MGEPLPTLPPRCTGVRGGVSSASGRSAASLCFPRSALLQRQSHTPSAQTYTASTAQQQHQKQGVYTDHHSLGRLLHRRAWEHVISKGGSRYRYR
eukprot:CAMPEP_0181230348 /NCGR_PEP_ID=MMETSP1096-20121128/34419_1 /TAXON_ID=156174 ORGANISM="Chrysochromulina ericina, Strain CCMP281" /NCGR_SAMPLE_ID=MMETSP1096 /ASSEMBLY_ACC=CAM_ASM_000453 /LENGTH=94 /DNA_ID=CAMNT_0023324105 /DNA_START=241 /DNA_END=521 /DNA_ORIENTATION=+